MGVTLCFPHSVRAWLDCPYGKLSDPYPGSCAFYLDTNNNQICDHSEPEPLGLANPASVYCQDQGGTLEMRTNDLGTAGYCLFPDGSECEEWAYYRGECGPAKPESLPAPPPVKKAANPFLGYLLIPLLTYLIHWYLATKTKLSQKITFLKPLTFRRFWNWILLITFLPVAVTSLLFVFGVGGLNYAFWHGRLGLIFLVVSTLHIFLRLRSFRLTIKS